MYIKPTISRGPFSLLDEIDIRPINRGNMHIWYFPFLEWTMDDGRGDVVR